MKVFIAKRVNSCLHQWAGSFPCPSQSLHVTSSDLVFLWDSKCKMPGRMSPEVVCGELLALGHEFLVQQQTETDGFPCWQPNVLYSRRKVRAVEAPEMERGWPAPCSLGQWQYGEKKFGQGCPTVVCDPCSFTKGESLEKLGRLQK